MHDIKAIREHPELFDEAMKLRGEKVRAKQLLSLDETKRKLQSELQALQEKRNQIAKQVGKLKASGEDAGELLQEAKAVGNAFDQLKAQVEDEDTLYSLLTSLPNLPAKGVPEGEDESHNIEVRIEGTRKKYPFTPLEHWQLGENLGLFDTEVTAKMSGSRFVTLSGPLARLERALANFMLDIHTNQHGFTEISPPHLVRDKAMFNVGQLPKFTDESFTVSHGFRLIPTAEVSLVNFVADSILDSKDLPLRYTAYTPCFRAEAGAAGKDLKGLFRVHQFFKVELVSITTEEASETEHEHILTAAESILQALELPYRVMLLCSGDMGFSASKTYDLEVWLPGQGKYREISSISNCDTFQARRMKARYRNAGDKATHFIHSLNGSGLAIGRTLIAIMENYQQEDGSIVIPDALQPYMAGETRINKE